MPIHALLHTSRTCTYRTTITLGLAPLNLLSVLRYLLHILTSPLSDIPSPHTLHLSARHSDPLVVGAFASHVLVLLSPFHHVNPFPSFYSSLSVIPRSRIFISTALAFLRSLFFFDFPMTQPCNGLSN